MNNKKGYLISYKNALLGKQPMYNLNVLHEKNYFYSPYRSALEQCRCYYHKMLLLK